MRDLVLRLSETSFEELGVVIVLVILAILGVSSLFRAVSLQNVKLLVLGLILLVTSGLAGFSWYRYFDEVENSGYTENAVIVNAETVELHMNDIISAIQNNNTDTLNKYVRDRVGINNLTDEISKLSDEIEIKSIYIQTKRNSLNEFYDITMQWISGDKQLNVNCAAIKDNGAIIYKDFNIQEEQTEAK